MCAHTQNFKDLEKNLLQLVHIVTSSFPVPTEEKSLFQSPLLQAAFRGERVLLDTLKHLNYLRGLL